jgi:hypothetical protein
MSAHFDSLYLSIFDAAGTLLSNPDAVGGNSFGRDAIGVADGFIGVQNLDSESFAFPAHRVAKVFPDGGTQETEFDGGLGSQGEDPGGGMLVLVSGDKTLTAYDPDLAVRWETRLSITDWNPIDNFERLPVGVETGGNSLVLFPRLSNVPDGGVMGIWTNAQGRPGVAFDAQQSTPAFCLRLMASLTGGLFVQERCPGSSGRVLASFASLDPHPGPVPDWLVQRAEIDLRRIRRSTGYAAISATLPSPSGCSIEVLTPEGLSCGRVDFGPSVAASDSSATGADAGGPPAPSCTFAVGADGTVIALTSADDPINGTIRWTWHWWPGFFR